MFHAHTQVDVLHSLSITAPLHKTREEEAASALLSLAPFLPGQTCQDELPAFLFCPFSLPAGVVLRVFFPPSKCSIAFALCSAGTGFHWKLGDVGILWGNLHIPIFNIINWKKPPSNEQFVRSELSASEDESSSQRTLKRSDRVTVGVKKTQKGGNRWTHTHNYSHAYAVCTIASVEAHIPSLLALQGQWRHFLWLLLMLCSWVTEGVQLTGLVSSCWDFGCYIHNFGRASERSPLSMKRSKRIFIFYFLFLLKNDQRSFHVCWKIVERCILNCSIQFPLGITAVMHDHTHPANLSLHIVHGE